RETSRSPIFDVLFSYQNTSLNDSSLTESTSGEIYDEEGISSKGEIRSKFDVDISMQELNGELHMDLVFNPDVYDEVIIREMMHHFKRLLQEVLVKPQEKVGAIQYLFPGKVQEQLEGFNPPEIALSEEETALDLFKAQSNRTPNNIALVVPSSSGDVQLTYTELDELSNRLANYLLEEYQLQPEELVGIKLNRSHWMLVSVLAVLKTGAAYVPIDPEYPAQRVKYIEEDSKCKVTIDDAVISNFQANEQYSTASPDVLIKQNTLAYVIYTSGSTGNPKGVMIEHVNLYSFLKWAHSEFEQTKADTVLFTTSLNFDLSIFEMLYPLTTGKKVRLLKNGLAIAEHLATDERLLINTVPSVVSSLVDLDVDFSAVEALNMAGEPIPEKLRSALLGKINEIRNLYGPSEDTTYSTVFRLDQDARNLIGRPISNTNIFLLNDHAQLQPVGTVGEIHIGGSGLFRGYINQEDLTSEIIISNPFNEAERLYKTGDLAKWTLDGQLQFIGRKDDQVKIRGYRIELQEIQQVLSKHASIDKCTVVALENKQGNKEISTYYEGKNGLGAEQLRSFLKKTLPNYMLPTHFVRLDQLPLTDNGKIDKKALPHPSDFSVDGQTKYIEPESQLEKAVAEIWEEVLEREHIGLTDDFFSLGGHSLRAVRINNQFQKRLGVTLDLDALFSHTTIADQVDLIQDTKEVSFVPIPSIDASKEGFPISDAQRRLWTLNQFEDDLVAYNMPSTIELDGEYNEDWLKLSFDRLIERHEILRTIFNEDPSGEVKQFIQSPEQVGFRLIFEDYSEQENSGEQAKSYVSSDMLMPFDLEKGPLIRASLIKVRQHKFLLYFNTHHIISDGWSLEVLYNDLFSIYGAYQKSKGESAADASLKELQIHYKDYSAWQLDKLTSEESQGLRTFWGNQLSGDLPLLNLPSSKQRPRLKTYAGRALSTSINSELTAILRTYTENRDGSVFMGLLAVWNVLMYRYTAQKDIVTGSPVAGREHPDLEDQIGFYVNTVAFRNRIQSGENFDTFFSRLRRNTLDTYTHQNYPFDRLVEDLDVKRDTSRNPIFDVMLVLQNESSGKFREMQLSQRSSDVIDTDVIVDLGITAAKFDIDLTFQEVGDTIDIEFIYNSDVYEHQMMIQLIQHFKRLLEIALNQSEIELEKLDFLNEQDKVQLTEEFNNYGNKSPYPKDKTIADLFEEQVVKTPQKVAIGYSLYGQTIISDKLTYTELNERSNQLAHYLMETRDVTSGDLVGVVLDRSLDYAISLLGILKASACCAPVNPDFPSERKSTILSNTKTVIDANLLSDLDKTRDVYSVSNPSRSIDPSSLAYVLFTSGSTGESKGCMLENEGIINHLYSKIDLLDIDSNERILHTSKMYFVGGIWQLWAPLISGAELIIPELEAIQDIGELIEKSIQYQVNVLEVIPSQMSNLFALDDEVRLDGLKTLILTGEPLKEQLIQQVLSTNSKLKIVNTYGQTECSDVTTMYEISSEKEWNHRLVGNAIQNTKHYILDENGQLCPLGVTGEIHTAGVCVSRGYLNKEELTSNFFKENPFVEGERLYKTGDLAKWTENGELEFVGRKDDQVKVRGYRVEPGEIERAVLKHPKVEETVVTILENPQGENELVVYFTASDSAVSELMRAFLRQHLVEYMIPSYYVQLQEIPLTSNGKVDKKSLPIPEGFGQADRSTYVAPKTELEQKLVDIWTKVLLREQIGCQDDFFDLGGHSLKAVRLNNAYQKELSVKLSLRDLLTSTTIASHVKLLEKASKSKGEFIPELTEDQISDGVKNGYPISDAQRRIWVLSQFSESSIAYNMTGAVQIDSEVEVENMERSLEFLVNRHEVLRTVFKEDDRGEIKQWIQSKVEIASLFSFHDFSNVQNNREAIERYIDKEANTVIDLEQGPLLKVALLKKGLNEFFLFFNVHHIIGDGWSLDVLSRDIFTCYDAFKNAKTPALSPLRIQYKEYAFWQQEKLTSSAYDEHQSFWMSELDEELPILDLPSSRQRPKLKTSRGRGFRIALENELVSNLKQYSTKRGGSLFTGLLAVWNVLLHRYAEQSDIIIGTPVAGRDQADLENQIGCYVNTLALRNEVNPESNFNSFHDKVAQRFQESYEHSEYPFDRLVDDLELKRDTSRNAIFDVMLVLQEFDGTSRHNEVELLKPKSVESGLEELAECTAKFDLDISFQEVQDVFSMQLIYNSDVYDAPLMKQLVVHFTELLSRVLENPEVKISELDYLTDSEKKRILNQSLTKGDYPKDENVVSLFESQVDATPDHTAIVFPSDEGEKRMTYAELDAHSNQLANYLKSKYRIEANDLIGMKLERSEWIPAVILGILKSGGAYVPIDPSSPDQRVAFIEEDTGCKLLLDQKELDAFIALQSTLSSKRPSNTI
ncbi:MAG: amino acid adenylation domain-containing protein, partial [Crocinitomicaceae bacterium]